MKSKALISTSLLLFAIALSGCGSDSPIPPIGPSPTPIPPAVPPTASGWHSGYTLTAASLSGVVYESTPTGRVPIPGAVVYCEDCGEITHTWAVANADGVYRFPGDPATGGGIWLSPGRPTPIMVRGVNFEVQTYAGRSIDVSIVGDTRLDVELVRR